MRAWSLTLGTVKLGKVALPFLLILSIQNLSLYWHIGDTEPFLTWEEVVTKTGGKDRETNCFAPFILSKQLGEKKKPNTQGSEIMTRSKEVKADVSDFTADISVG